MIRVINNGVRLYAVPKDGLRFAIDLEASRVTMQDLCEFVGLKHFDYAVPVDYYGKKGVWSYDSTLGQEFCKVFGGFLSLERIIAMAEKIAGDLIVDQLRGIVADHLREIAAAPEVQTLGSKEG